MFKPALNIVTAIFACFLLIVIFMPINSNAQNAELFSFLKQKSSDAKPASIAAESEQPIDINFKVINSKTAKTFQMPLLDGKTYDVKQSNEEGFISRGEEDYTWRGKLKDAGEWTGDVILTVKGKAMSGLIYAPSGVYEIIPQKNFTHVLVKIDPSLFPDSSDDDITPPILNDEYNSFKFFSIEGKSNPTPPISRLDNGTQIDVLIVYTAAVRTRLGGAAQAEALAQQAVAATNTAYQNSGISTRLRLVQTMEVSYADNGDGRAGLDWVTADATVAAARNNSKADLVSILTENANDVCGIAWRMTTNSVSFERYGFSLVQRSCAVSNLTLAHEIGHNQGSQHNPENSTSTVNLYPYNFGHWNATANFRTIMSYSEPCPSCVKIPYFSNPSISYNGSPIGIPNERDNTRTINNTVATVSQFRESGGGVGGNCQFTPITSGQTLNGSLATTDCTIEGRGYADLYTFTATAGQKVTVSLNSSAFDTYLYLVSATGQIINEDDNGGGGTNSRIPANSGSFTLPLSGAYTIRATSRNANSTGNYSLSLTIESNPCSTTPISPGQTINGELATTDCVFEGRGYGDIYTFAGTAGYKITISMKAITNGPSSFDSYLYLLGPNGQIITENDDSNGSLNSRIPASPNETFTLPSSGTYTIRTTTFAANTLGAYSLNFTMQPNVCAVTPISSGQTNGSLTTSDCSRDHNYNNYADVYSFTAVEDQAVTITLNSSDFRPVLELLREDGSVLEYGKGSTESTRRIPENSGSYKLPSAGIYKIRASSSSGEVGNYSLDLTLESYTRSIKVSFYTNPNGVLYKVDGVTYDTQTDFTWDARSSHTISVEETTQGNSRTRNVFLGWDDGGANTHTVSPNSDTSYHAIFQTQHYLTVNAEPGGTVSPASDWINAGYNVQITATPDSGYNFNGWTGTGSGSYSGLNNPATVTMHRYEYYFMDKPITQTAKFSAVGSHNRKTAGVFRPSNGITYLRNSNTGGFADIDMVYGVAGDQSIAGDWDKDGIDSLGIYRNGIFYLRNSNTTGPADIVFAFGSPGDQPIAGDWDGDGIDTIGVYRRSTGVFILRNSNSAGEPDTVFVLGNPGDIAIAGDWNGDGITTTGVFRPTNGIIYLKNTNVSGIADIYLVYGNAGDKPLAGDWDGDGQDSVGIYRDGVMYLRNSNTQGFADIVFALGNPGDEPIAGDWDGLP